MAKKFILGVFLRAQTFEMATGIFDPDRGRGNSVTVWDVASDDLIATGSIDHGQFNDDSYALSARLTGYPRAHATPGVDPKYEKGAAGGGGWGTPLYVAEATSAYLHAEFSLPYRSGTEGDKAGVSSASESRSTDAKKWWTRAAAAGLTEQESPCSEEDGEMDVEDEPFEFDDGAMPGNVDNSVIRAVESEDDVLAVQSVEYKISGYWSGTRKGTEEKCTDVDILTYDNCVAKGLVLLNTDATDRDGSGLGFYAWDKDLLDDVEEVQGDVLRIVNTGYLSKKPKGLEAMRTLVRIARKHLTAPEVASMIERFDAGADVSGPRYEEAVVAVENPGRSRIRRVRIGRHTVLMRTNPRRMVVPRVIAHGSPIFYGPRPNPRTINSIPASLKKNLEALYQRRVAMGYGALANLL